MEYIKLKFDKKIIAIQHHVHEFQGFLKIADDHYHRCTGVTGEAIPIDKKNHIHEIVFRTDFINGHYHEFIGRTSGAVLVGDRHIHYVESVTSTAADHKHDFRLIAVFDDPYGE